MLIVANWKTYFSFTQSIDWINHYGKEIADTIKQTNHTLVICPSIDALPCLVSTDTIKWGAQDCSPYQAGAYTGEVLAQSLAQIGCKYCIIGHSERRLLFHETTLTIILKLEQLVSHKIRPIVCIGETEQEYQADNAQNSITAQLLPIVEFAKKQNIFQLHIAYEPVWAIGTNTIAPKVHLDAMAQHIKKLTTDHHLESTILYGGSIHASSIDATHFEFYQGLLIGKASTDFQELKKIIESL